MEMMVNFKKNHRADFEFDAKQGELMMRYRGYDESYDAMVNYGNLLRYLGLEDSYGKFCFGVAFDFMRTLTPQTYDHLYAKPQSRSKECMIIISRIKKWYLSGLDRKYMTDIDSTAMFICKLILSFISPEYDYRYEVIDRLFGSKRFSHLYELYARNHRWIFGEVCEDAKRNKWKPEYAVDRYVEIAAEMLREEMSEEEFGELVLH